MKLSTTPRKSDKPPKSAASIRIPGATYRLSFKAGFTFSDARKIVPYLRGLGITDVYASPLFQAAPGSDHGYDVCCSTRMSDTLGGSAGFGDLADTLKESGLGLLLDIVPNHMGAHASNAWWSSVLKEGRDSVHARIFDIDWDRAGANGKVVLPVLGERLPKIIAAGELQLARAEGGWKLKYHEHEFPISTDTPGELIEVAARTHAPELILQILDQQHYRLAHWRTGADEINYRRFFDVTGLVALRVEDEAVFDETHAFVMELLAAGAITGLRVDHPDGLLDPAAYFRRLRERTAFTAQRPPFIVVEKILSGSETLPEDWPVQGTTGYDFLNEVNGLCVARSNERLMTQVYREITGCEESFFEHAYRGKKKVLELSFRGEADALGRQLRELAMQAPSACDFTSAQLRSAIIEVIACFPVYRTYVGQESITLTDADAAVIDRAVEVASVRCPGNNDAIRFLRGVLRLEIGPEPPIEQVRRFVLRFQQLSGPAAAKGIEDTAFYNHSRLISLNEVGGDLGEFGISISEFHARNAYRAETWPHTLLATATHDTKRGEDVRARLNVLSEMPLEWGATATRWRGWNARFKKQLRATAAPDAIDEYLLYQTIAAMWDRRERPEERLRRIAEYALKAARESKRQTSWIDPVGEYETGLNEFIGAILDPARSGEFLADAEQCADELAFFGKFNSIAQTVLKLTCPGVPDIYQGSELFDLSLVDPDNRRPVDFALRERLLEWVQRITSHGVDSSIGRELVEQADGAAKLFVIWKLLGWRAGHRSLFENGAYDPVEVQGGHREHVCAFGRSHGEEVVIVAVPRLIRTLLRGERTQPVGPEVWQDTALVLPKKLQRPGFTEELTGAKVDSSSATLHLGELFVGFPAAVLTS